MELKSPADAQATLERAHNQLQTYRAKAPELLRFNQVCVISDGVSARLGLLTVGLDRFAPWRTIDGATLDDAGLSELEVIIRGVFAPKRFLDLIVDYVAFEVKDGVVKSKKLTGYHQFHAVRKALASTVGGAGADGARKGGVVWHTQGSGKVADDALLRAAIAARPHAQEPDDRHADRPERSRQSTFRRVRRARLRLAHGSAAGRQRR